MNYTIQDYQNVIDLTADPKLEQYIKMDELIAHCEAKIRELSKPKPKMYRCIKEIQGYIWETGAEVTEHAKVYGISPPELPFHFELIPEPVKLGPITWEGLIDIILKCNWGTYSSTAEAIVERIKSDHNL